MDVLIINQYFYPDISATSQILTDLSIELTKYFDITVLCGKPTYNPVSTCDIKIFKLQDYNKCKIIRTWNTCFSRKSFLGRITNYLTFMFFGIILSLFFKKRDLIFTMTDPPFVAFIAYINYKLKRIPYIITLQDIHPDIELHTNLIKKNIFTNLWIKINKTVFNNSKKIIVLGNTMKNYLINKYNLPFEKIIIIPNYINDETIVPQPKKNKFLQDKEFKDNFIVMHSGNLGLNQDLHIIIEVANLLSAYKDIVFVLIGDGALKEQLTAKVKSYNLNNVYFLPYQSKEDLSYSLSAADVHLITLAEGLTNYIFPSKLYGIMAVGRPIIACIDEKSDIDQIINEAKCGISIKPNNPYRFAEAIIELYQNQQKLIVMGNNARVYLEKYLRRRYVIEKYRDLFNLTLL